MGAAVPPISVQPSGKFLGKDGNWYTFELKVGTPPQTVEVLPSTQIAESLVVDVHGCDDSPFSECSGLRGGLFDNTTSSSWEQISNSDFLALGIEAGLGGDPNDGGYWGYDTIGMTKADGSSLTIDRQVVTHYLTNDYFVGSVGLAQKASDITGNSQPSFLTAAYNKKDIPSLSYSYTAGAYYRQSAPSLTLGGQDLSRFQPNSLNFTMAPSGPRELSAGVQAITLDTGNGTTDLLNGGIVMFIDTTQPYLWLPKDPCSAFALAFGLEKDEITSRYSLTTDQHQLNIANNASITFKLGNMNAGGETIDIVFPYASFDLNYTQTDVTVPKTKFMFPIREQDNQGVYAIGRAFFQEAYLSVNYEFSNFSIYQAVPSANAAPAQIVALPSIDGKATSGTSPGAPVATQGGSSGLPAGTVAGIIVAVLLVLGGAILAFFCMRRRKRHREAKARGGIVRTYSEAPESGLPPELEPRDSMRETKPEYFGYIQKSGKFHQKPYEGPVMSSDSSQRGELDSNGPHSPAMSSPPDVTTAYHETAQELAAAPAPLYELPTRTTSYRDSHRFSQGPSPALEPPGEGPSSPSPLLARDAGDWDNGTHLEEASLHSGGRPSMMSADSVIILQPGSPILVSNHGRSSSRIVSTNLDEGRAGGSEAAGGQNDGQAAILAATTMAYGTNPQQPLSPTNPMIPALAARENRSQDTLVGSHEAVRRDDPESPMEDFVHNSPEHASLGYGSRWERPS